MVFPIGYSCGVLQVDQTQALASTLSVLSILSSFVLNPIIFGSLLHLTGQEDHQALQVPTASMGSERHSPLVPPVVETNK